MDEDLLNSVLELLKDEIIALHERIDDLEDKLGQI